MSRRSGNLDARLAEAIIGRIDRFREGKTDVATLVFELRLFVETSGSEPKDLNSSLATALREFADLVSPDTQDPPGISLPGRDEVSASLARLERLLREIR